MNSPYLQNQDPAPDSTNNDADAPVYLEAVDDQGDLDPESVEIYVNGTLAWWDGHAMPGFTGVETAVSGGYSYQITPAEPFEPGTQTVRAIGQDLASNSMDETYSFTTRTLELEAVEEISDQTPTFGIDLKLNTHDLTLSDDLDLALIAGVAEVAQHLLVGLKLFLGEWFLAEDDGIPYWQHVLTNAPNTRVIEGLFRQDILADQDIESLTSFVLELDRATRKVDVDFVAVSKIGIIDVNAVFPR